MAVGLVIAAMVAFALKRNVDRLAERDFAVHTDEVKELVSNRLADHARILLSGAALFHASKEVTRAEWHAFTQYQHIDKQLPGIQGIGFSLLIPRSELSRHLQQIRSEGFPEYKVIPEGDREIYTSIIYLEPFSGRNLRAFSYDMFSEPVRRLAMERARDTDAAALSGKVVLVQETDQDVQAGTLMYVPVYRKDMRVDTVAQRRAALLGWVYSPYRMDDLMKGVLGGHTFDEDKRLHLNVFDGERPSPESLLYRCHPSDGENCRMAGHFTRQIPLEFNGHRWTLCFNGYAGGSFSGKYTKVWNTLLGCMLVTFLLFALIRVLLNTRSEAQRLAEGLTVDLLASEASLRKTTERLSRAVRAGGVGLWDYDVVNNRLVWDDQMFRLYGITREQFSGAYEAWQAGLHPEDRQSGDEQIRLALQGEKEFDIEFRVLWPDGTIRHIRGFASVLRDADGRALRMLGTNWDITDKKRAEAALLESETNFSTFFETITDLIMVATPEGRILFTNAAATHTLGYAPEELLRMHLLDVHPADKREEAESIFADMFRGERESCPLPLVRKDGGLVPVETRVWFGKWNGRRCLFGICKNLRAEQEANQRFERLFRHNPCPIALTTLTDRRFVDINDTFLKTLGYSPEEIIGRSISELDFFEDPDQQVDLIDRLVAEGRVSDIELRLCRKDGSILHGLFSGEVIGGQLQRYLLLVVVDITARKGTEAELARLSTIQHTVMLLATDFVNVPLERHDASIQKSLETMGQLVDADRAYLFAYDFDQGTTSNTHEWCGPGITPEIGNLQAVPLAVTPDWVDAHRQGLRMYIPDVEALPADSTVRQVLEPQGIRSLITLPLMHGSNCLGFVGFDAVREKRVWREEEVALLQVLAELYAHFEIRRVVEHEMRDLQKRLTQARDAAQEAALAKSLFLANMSHEIRTPLNAILGYAQIMGHECRACPRVNKLNVITRSGEHLLELLTDLMELVRSDAHEPKLAQSTFDLYQALEDVRMMFAQYPAAQALTLAVSHAPDVPQFICADSGKIRQILVNLMSNALKYTAAGRVCVRASVGGETAPGDFRIAVDVEDTGCGIGDGDRDHIFDLFYTQPDGGRRVSKGTGLGLPLSQRYARALGGDITLSRSVPGEGSCFRFTFLARAADADSIGLHHEGNVLRLAPDQPAIRVLVVDDDPASREMLADMLKPLGFEVETEASAAKALFALCQTDKFDLVLMDKHMPEMDGYEAIRRLRKMPGGCDLSVLVVTASGFADEREPAIAAGADGYVAKPVHRERLLEEIGRVSGVRYEYEPISVVPEATHPLVLDAEMLAIVPVEQRRLLGEALYRGDILRLRELVDAIAREHAGLADGLRVLVDAYDYGRLCRLLESVKETPA